MTNYETIAVPFQTTKDGREYLTELQLAEIPELGDFIKRFPQCFERDPVAEIWWFDRHGRKNSSSDRT